MWLTEISFKALISTLQLYVISSNINPYECVDELVGSNKFEYYVSDGLSDPFEIIKQKNQKGND